MESEIIQKIILGEVDLFRVFIDRYKDMAFSIAISIIRDETLAEDIVQSAFIKAFKNLKQFEKRSKFSTWFYAIVVNEARGQMRKHKLHTLSFDSDSFHETESAETNKALYNLQVEDQRRVINNTLSRLSPRESLLMRLFYLNENSIEEIRKITGFTISNIKTSLHRARQHFYHILKKELKGELTTLLSVGE